MIEKYQVTLHYDKEDETEILIRVLSFGPMIRVVKPMAFINLIKGRLSDQKKLWTVKVRNFFSMKKRTGRDKLRS